MKAAEARDGVASEWHARGRIFKERGDLSGALANYRRALTIDPCDPSVLTSLGTALYAADRRDQALECYREALAAAPAHAGARASLDALLCPMPGGLERLVQLREEAARLHGGGRLTEAFELHREALRVMPQAAGVWLSAGLLANELGEQWASLPLFEEAARLKPTLLPAIEAARRICIGVGLFDKAAHYSRQAYALRPSDDIRIAAALCVGAIQPSARGIDDARRVYEAGLDDALRAGLEAGDAGAAHGMGAFFLAYHGRNDRHLQVKAAALLSSSMPSLSFTAAHCRTSHRRAGKVRVGFISAFLFGHSIGKTTRGLLTELSRERFEVFALRIKPSKNDDVTELIRLAADHMIELDAGLAAAREQIAALELDVLFYQDIGMEPTSYLLAFARLAAVQCVSFGHPNTTGVAAIDYFVSNDLYEPSDAVSHYSEKLFLLRDLPTLAYYYRPQIPAPLSERAAFGLSDEDHVYVCPQTLFKIHPEFDAILAQILKADPVGVLVLIRGQYDDYTRQIRSRLSTSLGGAICRVLMLDPMGFPRFMQLLALADVCLDTIHFNGMNSSLEAFSAGTPIVTLPGRLQRGRHTQAMYKKMGITDCIARDPSHYVEIALRLGTDPCYARDVRRRILERNGVLYEDRRVVTEFERFFLHAIQERYPAELF